MSFPKDEARGKVKPVDQSQAIDKDYQNLKQMVKSEPKGWAKRTRKIKMEEDVHQKDEEEVKIEIKKEPDEASH